MLDYDQSMFNYLGIKNYEELFSDIPLGIRKKKLNLDQHCSEYKLIQDTSSLSESNRFDGFSNFLGCGVYDRIIPSSVDSIVSRSEFLTSYTPYQAEISQGMLQSLFEYQSIISDLLDMDAANSSMYDGPTALGEAARMAVRINDRRTILIPDNIYRNKRNILINYCSGLDVKFREYSFDMKTGMLDLEDLESKIDGDVSAVIVENPNSYGIIDENVLKVKQVIRDSLLISYVDPISLGVLKPPGEYGSDISVAEGQQLGIHQNFGGPYLGIFTYRKELARKSPGRLIGETIDTKGRRGYVMTLQTREQHIRREKATSNICTNQALMGVAALAYLATVGPSGLRKIALATVHKSAKLKQILSSNQKVKTNVFSGTSFSDVPLLIESDEERLYRLLRDNKIFGGIKLDRIMDNRYDKLKDAFFFSNTEKTDDTDLLKLKNALEAV
jgi:glycine dehydrogenase subunit 1